jgi:hypothetical protein
VGQVGDQALKQPDHGVEGAQHLPLREQPLVVEHISLVAELLYTAEVGRERWCLPVQPTQADRCDQFGEPCRTQPRHPRASGRHGLAVPVARV